MTDFICPVEGCDAIYGDWETLREHLAEAHKQDTTQEQYQAWRETVTEQESEQRQRQGTEQDDKGTPIERDVPVSNTSLSCPFCEKAFDRGTLDKSFNSVKMHAIRSHGEKLTRADLDLPPEEEEGRKPSRKPSYKHKETEEEEGFFEKTATEGEPFVRMPDIYQAMWQHARTFGLSKRGADTFVASMKNRDPDNLDDWREALRDMRADEHTAKLLIDNWARQRGIGPYGRDYRSYRSQGYDYRYGQRDRDWQPEPKDEVSQLIEREYDELRKIRVIQALQGGGEDGSEVKLLRDEVLNLKDSKVEELEKQLQQEREQRHQNELKALEERMNTRIEALTNSQGTVFERQAVKAVERLGDVSERMVDLGEKLIVATAYKHRILEPEPPIPRERQGPSGIAALIPAEYIERRAEEAADA